MEGRPPATSAGVGRDAAPRCERREGRGPLHGGKATCPLPRIWIGRPGAVSRTASLERLQLGCGAAGLLGWASSGIGAKEGKAVGPFPFTENRKACKDFLG